MPITNKYISNIKSAQEEIAEIFGMSIDDINIEVVENRLEYEKILNRKTADWEIGNSDLSKKRIILLDPEQWEKEAPMHKSDEFSLLIRHELTHFFVDNLAGGRVLPMWLNEGLSGAISGQYKTATVKFFEDNFCSKLDTPYNWGSRSNSGAYPTAYLFTHYLLDKYEFQKIKDLIQLSPRYYSYNRFNKTVSDVFGKNLVELENDFIDSLE